MRELAPLVCQSLVFPNVFDDGTMEMKRSFALGFSFGPL
jgi:hypothetical protein